MERRKFLIGTGSIAAGSAATIGSGAFGVTLLDRNADGTIEDDTEAYLQLIPNGEFSEIESDQGDDELNVTLQRLNSNSVTELDDIFYIQNDGQEQVDVTVSPNNDFAGDVTISDVFVSSQSGNGGAATVDASLIGNREPLSVGGQIGIGVVVEVAASLPDGASSGGTFEVDAN